MDIEILKRGIHIICYPRSQLWLLARQKQASLYVPSHPCEEGRRAYGVMNTEQIAMANALYKHGVTFPIKPGEAPGEVPA